jgi:DNA ligase (NAD+)
MMKKVKIISKCPACDSELARVKDQLFCLSPTCKAVASKRVQAFAKVMKIKGLGEKTVEKLGFEDIRDIYSIKDEILIDKIGEKLGRKLLQEIEGSRTVPISVFLSALSIPLLGSTAARKLSRFVKDISDIDRETCELAGLGPKVTDNLLRWIELEGELPQELGIALIPETAEDSIKPLNLTVVVSGKVDGYTRDSIRQYLETYGIKVVGTVSKNTDYLICNDKESNSSKVKKASELEIEILTMNEFKEILND